MIQLISAVEAIQTLDMPRRLADLCKGSDTVPGSTRPDLRKNDKVAPGVVLGWE